MSPFSSPTRRTLFPCLAGAILLFTPIALHSAPGDINTVAGDGTALHMPSTVPGPATSTGLPLPTAVAYDPNADVFYSIAGNLVRKIDNMGNLTAYAGTGAPEYTGDGGAATSATFHFPQGLAVDDDGNLYIADTANGAVRKVDAMTGIVTTFAGDGSGLNGTTGDGGAATSAKLNNPVGLAFDSDGNLLIGTFDVIRKVDAMTGIISTIAGTAGSPGHSGDGGLATAAKLRFGTDIAIAPDGDIVFTDHVSHTIRRIDSTTGNISTLAGTDGMTGSSGDGGDAASALVNEPYGIDIDLSGNIFFADSGNEVIRKIHSSTNIISTIAGTGSAGFSGDGGSALIAQLNNPLGIAIGAAQGLYLTDYGNNRVRLLEGVATFVPMPKPDNLVGPKISKLKGNNLYGSPAGQKSRQKIDRGRKAKLFYLVQNEGNSDDQFRLRVSKGKRKLFKPKWIANGQNVTAAIQAGGYVTPSTPEGGSQLVIGKIKFQTTRGKSVYRFSAQSLTDGSAVDNAIALIKVKLP